MWWLLPLLLSSQPAPAAVGTDAVLHLIRERFERTGRSTPVDDPALSRAAAALATKALRTSSDHAAGLLSVTEAVSYQNGWDPSPLALFIKAPVDELLKALGQQAWADDPIDFVGVGLVTEGRQASLCVLLSRRRLELEPFARSHRKPPTPQRLCATLAPPLTTATVYVTRPRGDVDEIAMAAEKGRWCAFVPFSHVGRSAVELLARGPAGPEVAALFFVDVGSIAGEDEHLVIEPTTVPEARSEIVARINSLRRSQKLSAVAADLELDAVAQAYADRMATEGFFAHVSPDGSTLEARLVKAGYRYNAAGENLGSSSGPLAAHFGIEHSPGHRKNLLEPGFERVGVGIGTPKHPNAPTVVTEVLATPLIEGIENPVSLAYQALNQTRSRKKLPPLAPNAVLEALAQHHAREALKRDQPKVDLPGVTPLHERVFQALDEVKSASVDVYVTASASVAPESKQLGDATNSMVGVGLVRGDSARFGANKYWVVVIYAH